MQLFITSRQKEVVRAIRELCASGRNPTLEEVAQRVGMRSTNSVRRHLSNLEAMGIVRPRAYNRHRQIALAESLKVAA